MKNLLEHNLSSLAQHDPDLAREIRSAPDLKGARVQQAKSGDLFAIVNGITMHSRFNPVSEGEILARSPLVDRARARGLRLAVFGLGLGYHVKALTERLDEIWAIEPRLGLIRLAFSCLNFSPFMARVHLVTDRHSAADWPPTLLLPHPPSRRLDPKNYEFWSSLLDGQGKKRETSGDLKKACIELPGMEEVLSGLDPEKKIHLAELTRHIETREGVLSEAEILTLLLHELALVSNESQA